MSLILTRRPGAGRTGPLSRPRIRAVVRKEIQDYRRNRFIVVTMTVMPVIFMILPVIDTFALPSDVASSMLTQRVGLSLLYMLIVPAVTPAAISAYSVVGEREQGTMEPVLTTPLRTEEFLIGKALAALLPTLAISYGVFGLFLLLTELFAHPNVATAVFQGPLLLAQVLFTPLVAGWSIWAGIAISARSNDVRVAQQLSTLASLPPLAVTSLFSFGVLTPTLRLALILAAVLLVVDSLGWRAVSALFDRERLVTGRRAS
ncbi:ABC transporter permease subunit [Streptacidiphilus sp. MAP5-3]|uniref:ABC transporter permease subunit n=1 Tax=unclassified Streptacidiphilus TaxID=2643834 RepID=UPI0035169C03